MANVHPILSRQPVKGAYVLTQLLIIVWLRLPFYALLSIPRSYNFLRSQRLASEYSIVPQVTAASVVLGVCSQRVCQNLPLDYKLEYRVHISCCSL
jgi:hypothetical protein